jgi:hypothetical protein
MYCGYEGIKEHSATAMNVWDVCVVFMWTEFPHAQDDECREASYSSVVYAIQNGAAGHWMSVTAITVM